ncbi:hypothetical protein ACI2K4_25975 [Micromonospora sp. NPDC050397]|uniref:hypothetical protein n=1 Tax=Micromonospora sp. NPDC050397 TaxID=3364279 RepID=UPI00384F0645
MTTARSRRLGAVAAALMVVGTVLVVPTRAGAAPDEDRSGAARPATGGALPAGMTVETPTQVLANSIGNLGHTTYQAVFAGLTVDEAAGRVVVHATDVERAQRMVDQGRGAAPALARDSVAVEIRPAKYARPELERAVRQLFAEADRWKTTDAEIYSIVPRADGSGLEVRGDDPVRLSGLLRASTGLDESPVALADVAVVAGQRIHALNRDNPSPPYPGGIPIRWDWEPWGWDCTAAFGLYRPGGPEYLLTADHCQYVPGDWVEDANGDTVGVVREENIFYDAALIETDAAPYTYVNQDLLFPVRGAAWSWNNELVCHSGRTTVNRCDIRVTNESIYYRLKEDGNLRLGVEGRICTGCLVGDRGDSGGPVWSLRSDGYLSARGIISGGSGELPGGGFDTMIWTEVGYVQNSMNVLVQSL